MTDAVALVEDYDSRAKDLMAKAASTLATLHENMFPKAELPRTLGELVAVFRMDDPLTEYSCSQIVSGAKTTLMMAMAHGVQGDFNKVTSEIPKGPDGKEVVLAPFTKQANFFAKQLVVLLEHRAAEQAAAAAKQAAAASAS